MSVSKNKAADDNRGDDTSYIRNQTRWDGVAASSDCNRTEIDRDHIECRFRASKDSCPHFCEEAVRPLALY